MTLTELASYAFQIFAALGGAGIFVQLVFGGE